MFITSIRSFSTKLSTLYNTLDCAYAQKAQFEHHLSEAIGPTRHGPKLLSMSTHGAVIELTGAQYSRLKKEKGWKDLELVRDKGKGGKFKLKEWTEISTTVEEAKAKIAEEEARVFEKTKALVQKF